MLAGGEGSAMLALARAEGVWCACWHGEEGACCWHGADLAVDHLNMAIKARGRRERGAGTGQREWWYVQRLVALLARRHESATCARSGAHA